MCLINQVWGIPASMSAVGSLFGSPWYSLDSKAGEKIVSKFDGQVWEDSWKLYNLIRNLNSHPVQFKKTLSKNQFQHQRAMHY